MMYRWGYVRLRLRGLNAEKLLNAARRQGIRLRHIRREENRELSLLLPAREEAAFREIAEEKGYWTGTSIPIGMLSLERGILKRWSLLLGGLLAAALAMLLLSRIWTVRIENAGPYAGEVRTVLQEAGVQAGVPKSEISLKELRETLEWRLPQIQWAHVRWEGVSLVVRLEQGTAQPAPEPSAERMDVVAARDGLIRRLTVYAGTPMVQAGDMVKAGQLLIRGEEKSAEGNTVAVRARGEAKASVWYASRVRMPLTSLRSLPTGRTFARRVVASPYMTWCPADTPDYLVSDVEISNLPVGGVWLPVWIQRETYAEAMPETIARDAQEVRSEAEQAALRALDGALIADETVDKWINFSMIEGDFVIAEAAAEAVRDIGRREAVSSP